MNRASKGARNERRSRDLLEATGYAVNRAVASLGDWDLIGVGSTDFVFVHWKTRDWPGSSRWRRSSSSFARQTAGNR